MEYIYRNNAGRFRLESGVQAFLPPTSAALQAPALNSTVGIPSTPTSSSTASSGSRRPAQWFFCGNPSPESRDPLLKTCTFQESCPSIHLLSGGAVGPRNITPTQTALKKPHSSSAPNEGITGVEPSVCSPSPNTLDILKKNTSKGSPSLSGGGPVHLENPERETRWYFKYFLGKGLKSFQHMPLLAHQLYCGNISEKDPLLLAIVRSEFEAEGLRQYRAILWTKFVRLYVFL